MALICSVMIFRYFKNENKDYLRIVIKILDNEINVSNTK